MHVPCVVGQLCMSKAHCETVHNMLCATRSNNPRAGVKSRLKSSAQKLPRLEPWQALLPSQPTLPKLIQSKLARNDSNIIHIGENGSGKNRRPEFLQSALSQSVERVQTVQILACITPSPGLASAPSAAAPPLQPSGNVSAASHGWPVLSIERRGCNARVTARAIRFTTSKPAPLRIVLRLASAKLSSPNKNGLCDWDRLAIQT